MKTVGVGAIVSIGVLSRSARAEHQRNLLNRTPAVDLANCFQTPIFERQHPWLFDNKSGFPFGLFCLPTTEKYSMSAAAGGLAFLNV